jgi:C4-type Zn-finger protein
MEIMILTLTVSYLALLVLLLLFGHLLYRKRIKDLNTGKNATYRYYCPTCKQYFRVIYYVKNAEPLYSVECPFCKNDTAAFIIEDNDTPHRN